MPQTMKVDAPPTTKKLAVCYYCTTLVAYDPNDKYQFAFVNLKKYPICARCAKIGRKWR